MVDVIGPQLIIMVNRFLQEVALASGSILVAIKCAHKFVLSCHTLCAFLIYTWRLLTRVLLL